MNEAKKETLVVVRRSPYGSSLARSALDAALAMAAFEQPVKLLFLGEGVLQLLPEQDTQSTGAKNVAKLLASLPLYEIETVYADVASAQRYGVDISEAPVPTEGVSTGQIRQMMNASDHILGC